MKIYIEFINDGKVETKNVGASFFFRISLKNNNKMIIKTTIPIIPKDTIYDNIILNVLLLVE